MIKGEYNFQESIEFFNLVTEKSLKKNHVFKDIVEREELRVPFPEKVSRDMNFSHIKVTLERMRAKLHGKYILKKFYYDIITKDPKLLTVLQMTEDTIYNARRRKLLLSNSIEYVGINSYEIEEGVYLVYFLYAK